MASEVAGGVFVFLRDRFKRRRIGLHELFDRLDETLRRIGCSDVADHLTPEPPPMEVDLLKLASEAGDFYEMGFFKALTSEIDSALSFGATALKLTGARAAICQLKGTRFWTSECVELMDDLANFTRDMVVLRSGGAGISLLLS